MNAPGNEPILDYVKRRLNACKGDWNRIAKVTGVAYGTITNIAQGKSDNPTISSLQPLLNYFTELDAMLDRLGRGPETKALA